MKLIKKCSKGMLVLLLSIPLCHAKSVAITIDDLPFVGDAPNQHLNMIIEALTTNEVTATGFVIASRVNDSTKETLQKFRDAGLAVANHTYSHANLQKIGLNAFIADVDRADQKLKPYLTKPKFFRYPYLAMSSNKNSILINEYLESKHYHIAPITIDSKDYIFNQLLLSVPEKQRRAYLEALKPAYINFIKQQTISAEEIAKSTHHEDKTQILLIHANLLNAYVLADIIHFFQDEGYSIVSLNDILPSKSVTPQVRHPERRVNASNFQI